MTEYYDADGNSIEGDIFTQEEVAKQVEEANKISGEKLQEVKEKAKKLEEKDLNFNNLKKKSEETEKELKEKKELADKYQEEQDLKTNLTPNDKEKKILDELNVKDEEAVKKAMLFFRKLNTDRESVDAIKAEMEYAVTLTKPTVDPVTKVVAASGGGGRQATDTGKTELSADQQDLGNKLGLTNEDIEKYDK
jgi:hypothetical protein